MDPATLQPFSVPTLHQEGIVVTPVAEAPSAVGRVLSHEAGMAGLAIRVTAEVRAASAARLDGERAWVTVNTDGRLIVFQCVARRIGETTLELSGITAPVEEHRRGQVRAATRIPVHLRLVPRDGGAYAVIDGHTVDLSRGGCRVELGGPGMDDRVEVGATAQVTIDLGEPGVATLGDVVRVDPRQGQAVLQFRQLEPTDAERVERHVLSKVV